MGEDIGGSKNETNCYEFSNFEYASRDEPHCGG